MKRIAKRLALLGALAVVASVVTAAPASAQVSGTCGVQGSASVSPAVKVGPNSGNYTFNELLFACAGTIDGQTDVAVFDINTAGTYNNSICGTGTASSTSAHGTVTTSAAGNTGLQFDAPYDIAFQEGVGQLTFRSPASGSGVIDIIPTGPVVPSGTNPQAWDCTTSFNVVGEVSLTIP
jgi:hypothetical protein